VSASPFSRRRDPTAGRASTRCAPKRGDLIRDGYYAMHCFPPAQNEDAFYFTGRAVAHSDGALRSTIAQVLFDERKISSPPPAFENEGLFEFLIDSCLLTRTTGHGDYNPQHTVWKAGEASRREKL
jgi:hypothetical protein